MQNAVPAVLNVLDWDTTVPYDGIEAQVEDGSASLRGDVRRHFRKGAAGAAVRPLAGVVGVINQVTLKPRVDVTGGGTDIRTAPHCAWFFDGDTITVSVRGSTVRLTDVVDSPHDRWSPSVPLGRRRAQ